MIVDNVVKLDLQHRMLFHVIQFHPQTYNGLYVRYFIHH